MPTVSTWHVKRNINDAIIMISYSLVLRNGQGKVAGWQKPITNPMPTELQSHEAKALLGITQVYNYL